MPLQVLDLASDAVLAALCAGLAWTLRRRAPALALGLLFIGLAAALGVVRYAGWAPALGPHRFFTALAAGVGFPLLGYGLAWPDDPLARRPAGAFALSLCCIVLAVGLPHLGLRAWLLVAPALSAAAIGLAVLRRPRAAAPVMGWAVLLASFALNLAPWPATLPLSRATALHLLLAVALPLLLAGRGAAPALRPQALPPTFSRQ